MRPNATTVRMHHPPEVATLSSSQHYHLQLTGMHHAPSTWRYVSPAQAIYYSTLATSNLTHTLG